ncbi:MAG: hypothetical protein HKP44_13665 [Desulfofustis sp.]|nr:hypothetical protein [Desulfofustis sp.]
MLGISILSITGNRSEQQAEQAVMLTWEGGVTGPQGDDANPESDVEVISKMPE